MATEEDHRLTFHVNMMMKYILKKYQLSSVILLCCIAAFNSAIASSDNAKDWQFKVFLDGDEIGTHNFSVKEKGEHKEIHSSARFGVDFLFLNIYSYQHDDIEHWNGRCLKSIEASTNDNGEQLKVSGKIDNGAFIVNTLQQQHNYEACIKTFAYWDPKFLTESSLLNSQTGEMIDVKSRFIGNEALVVKGQTVEAKRYQLSGEALQIDLWYTEDGHWLQLESVTDGGRIVRYALYKDPGMETEQ